MRTRFMQGLDDLKEKLLRMGGLAERAMEQAITAYREHDHERCEEVFRTEYAINLAERQIDELAVDLLAMQQPMASDLRFILAVIKINGDLERVGDQAVNVAQRVLDVLKLPKAELPADIPRMASAASTMVRDALQAFIDADAAAAEDVLKRDNEVDRMKADVEAAMIKQMQEHPECVQSALDTLLIARNLERMADHATNIAEDVIFWVRGFDIRHHAADSAFPK